MDELFQAAEKAIIQALSIKEGEQFLLVTDKHKMEIAEAMAYWAKEAGAETTTYLMTETLRPITKPTTLFQLLCAKVSVMAYMLDARMEEKPFSCLISPRSEIGMSPSRDMMLIWASCSADSL